MSPDLTKLVEALNKAAPTKEEFAKSLTERIVTFAESNQKSIREGINKDGYYDLALDGHTFRFKLADGGKASDTASG
ncbi:MAG: hypothetical protein M1336_02355 [Deltaproteobacteria bacterium]|jgi:hypothetical protein|nr:hypothetical protein [Deltaproteobacteria bacterium]